MLADDKGKCLAMFELLASGASYTRNSNARIDSFPVCSPALFQYTVQHPPRLDVTNESAILAFPKWWPAQAVGGNATLRSQDLRGGLRKLRQPSLFGFEVEGEGRGESASRVEGNGSLRYRGEIRKARFAGFQDFERGGGIRDA